MQDGSFRLELVTLQMGERMGERKGWMDGGRGRYVDVFKGTGFHEVVVAVCAAVGEKGVACYFC